MLRIRAYGFGFGRFVWTLGETFPMQECSRRKEAERSKRGRGRDVKGFLHPKGRYGHVVSSGVCFPCVNSGVMRKEGETHME